MGIRRRCWATLGVVALLAVQPIRAQEAVPVPLPKAAVPPARPVALEGHAATMPAADGGAAGGQHPIAHEVDGHAGAEAEAADGNWFNGLYFEGSYLLLKPRRNALDFAVISPNTKETPGGTVQSFDWETTNGFRFGTGWRLPGKEWSLGITYTYAHSKDDQSQAAPNGGALYQTLGRAGGYDQVGRADGFSSIDYNVIDLDLSKKIKVHESLDLTVFGGGRFAWIDQQLAAVYNGGPDKAANDLVSSPVYFRGAGLTVGSEGLWNFWGGLGLYGRARASLLSGEFRNFLKETANSGTVSIVNVNEKYTQIVPVADIGLGVAYCGEHFHLSVGYELSNWFNMVNSIDFPDSSNIGKVGRRVSDVSLEGLAVQLGLVF